jgi:hypothetical protein
MGMVAKKVSKTTAKKAPKKVAKKATKKPVKKTEEAVALKRPPAKSKPRLLDGFYFSAEPDTNYENNVNITFVRKSTWDESKIVADDFTALEQSVIQSAVDKVGLDPEPIMPGVYSADFYTTPAIKQQLTALGATEIDTNINPTDVMAIVLEQEAQDAKARKGEDDCSGSCGGGCGSTP